MIHFGKEPSGDLMITVPAEDVGEVFDALESAGPERRPVLDRLKEYIAGHFADELECYRRRMTAQIPRKEDVCHAAV